MITRFLPLVAAVMLLLVAGCSDPVAPAFQPYTGVNGVVLDPITFVLPNLSVKTYNNLRMDFGKPSVEFMDALGIQRAIRLEEHKHERRDVSILLPLPANANAAGEYAWIDGILPSTTEAYMVLEREDVQFTSVRGKTVIESFGLVGGTVVDYVEGTIRHSETYDGTRVHGKFTAVRVN
jgi:hypothetical protein